MKNRIIIPLLLISLFSGCDKQNDINHNDIIYFNFNPDIELTCQTDYYGFNSTGIDLNGDGYYDFLIIATYGEADSIYRMKDEYHIYIRPLYINNNKYNPYTPSISMDTPSFVRLYNYYDGEFNDSSGVYLYHYLYKVDSDHDYSPDKNCYILLRLHDTKKSGDFYYGWLQLKYENFKVILIDYAYCILVNQKIKPGQIEN